MTQKKRVVITISVMKEISFPRDMSRGIALEMVKSYNDNHVESLALDVQNISIDEIEYPGDG